MMSTRFPSALIAMRWIDKIPFVAVILLRQKLHCVMDALEFASRDVQVAGMLSAAGQQDGVVMLGQRLDRHVIADVRVRQECDALSAHLVEPAIDDVLFKFEIRNPITQADRRCDRSFRRR